MELEDPNLILGPKSILRAMNLTFYSLIESILNTFRKRCS